MLSHVVALLLLLTPIKGGRVKLANFYTQPDYDEILNPLGMSYEDLRVLAVDTKGQQVRIPLKETPYYGLSRDWTHLNETMYFGRLSVFTTNYANQDVEHNLLHFQGNMTVEVEGYSVMSLVRNDREFSGYLCNLGERIHGKKTFVNLCLHNVTQHANIDPTLIKILVKRAACPNCTKYKMRPHIRGNSLEFGIPNSDVGPLKWNITIEYNKHTTLCHLIKELSPDDLNIMVMKQNLTVNSMFECVLYSEEINSNPMGVWVPIIAGLVSALVLAIAATVFYKKCDRACLRQMIPTPDQDTAAAPYRSFNSSNPCDSPNPDRIDNRYIKMKTVSSYESGVTGYASQNGSTISRQSEPYYERI